MLIERLRQSGYVIPADLRQPVRRPDSLRTIWQRIKGAVHVVRG